MEGRERFERNPESCLGVGFGRRPTCEHPGDFLGRLWALFGPPKHVGDGGFDYALRDRATGLAFNAYAGASGPAYGVNPADRAAIGPVLDAFDRLLDRTPPADCQVEYESEEAGPYRVGCSAGQPFEGPLPAELVRLLQTIHQTIHQTVHQTIDETKHPPALAPNDNPWTTMGDLGRLDSLWRLAPPEQRAPVEDRARATALALFEATMEKAKRLADRPAATPFRESFAEAGLDELRALADSALLGNSAPERKRRARRFAVLAARFKS